MATIQSKRSALETTKRSLLRGTTASGERARSPLTRFPSIGGDEGEGAHWRANS